MKGRQPTTTVRSRRQMRLSRRLVYLLVFTAAATMVLAILMHSTALTVAALLELGLAILLTVGLLRSRTGERIAGAIRSASRAPKKEPR